MQSMNEQDDGFSVAPSPSGLQARLWAAATGFVDGPMPMRSRPHAGEWRDHSTRTLRQANPQLHRVLRFGMFAWNEIARGGRTLMQLSADAQTSMVRVAYAVRMHLAEERCCLAHSDSYADPMTTEQAEIAAGIADPFAGRRVGVWMVLDLESNGVDVGVGGGL